ncbi:MAG TPA: hypothetical protein VHE55_10295 [Fimbriimonadaceae bacterium]|nr:hypothetical protein [Fimbriimonadaceae bacterium]
MKSIFLLAVTLFAIGVVAGCGSSDSDTAGNGPPPPHIPGPSKADMESTSKPSLANPTLSGGSSKK